MDRRKKTASTRSALASKPGPGRGGGAGAGARSAKREPTSRLAVGSRTSWRPFDPTGNVAHRAARESFRAMAGRGRCTRGLPRTRLDAVHVARSRWWRRTPAWSPQGRRRRPLLRWRPAGGTGPKGRPSSPKERRVRRSNVLSGPGGRGRPGTGQGAVEECVPGDVSADSRDRAAGSSRRRRVSFGGSPSDRRPEAEPGRRRRGRGAPAAASRPTPKAVGTARLGPGTGHAVSVEFWQARHGPGGHVPAALPPTPTSGCTRAGFWALTARCYRTAPPRGAPVFSGPWPACCGSSVKPKAGRAAAAGSCAM